MKLDSCEIVLALSNDDFLENIYDFDEFSLMQPDVLRWVASDEQISKLDGLLNRNKVRIEDIYVSLISSKDDDEAEIFIVSLNEFLSFDDYEDYDDIIIGIGQPYPSNLFSIELLSFLRR